MAGEVLGGDRDAACLHRLEERDAVPGYLVGLRAERPDTDDRVARVAVHVEGGREVVVHTRRHQVLRHRSGGPAGQVEVVRLA